MAEGNVTRSNLLVALRSSGSKPPLFCVHSSDGGTLAYEAMAQAMSADQPIYVCCAPELDSSTKITTVEELAKLYVSEIRQVQANGTYQICGQSFGGLVAYEMASMIKREIGEVSLLALFDTLHPKYWKNLSASEKLRFSLTYLTDRSAKYLRNATNGRLDHFVAEARQFIVKRSRTLLWRVLRKAAGTAGRPIPKMIRGNILTLAAACRVYSPKPYSGNLVLFTAQERTIEFSRDDTLGWRACAKSGVDVHVVPGGHVTMMHEPNVVDLVAQLTPYLA